MKFGIIQRLQKKIIRKLNNFYWLFSLDLKSSKKTYSVKLLLELDDFIIIKYNSKSWNFDLTAKRIIAWLSNHNLTYEDS